MEIVNEEDHNINIYKSNRERYTKGELPNAMSDSIFMKRLCHASSN